MKWNFFCLISIVLHVEANNRLKYIRNLQWRINGFHSRLNDSTWLFQKEGFIENFVISFSYCTILILSVNVTLVLCANNLKMSAKFVGLIRKSASYPFTTSLILWWLADLIFFITENRM